MGIPIIDLFAGPGGLGEGFSSLLDENGKRCFDIKLSIEMDENAHQTLQFRSFFRKFDPGGVPKEYYDVIKENEKAKRLEKKDRLYEKYWNEAEEALKEVWRCELGSKNFPPEIVDHRIEAALNGKKEWVLIGGPPCQAYSMAGRSRVGGIRENDNRVFLYQEYLRIIAKHQPVVFVMENVRGLLSAKLKGNSIFEMILNDLKEPWKVYPDYSNKSTYKIFSFVKPPANNLIKEDPEYSDNSDFLIRAERYGVPQSRHRVILLGIRADMLRKAPEILKQTNNQITVKDVIESLPPLRSGLSKRIIESFVMDDRIRHRYQKIEDSPKAWKDIINRFRIELDINPLDDTPECDTGINFIRKTGKIKNPLLRKWYNDPNIKGICNHEARNHLESDLKRYLFASNIAKKNGGVFPRLKDYPAELMPEHRNAETGSFNDRFRVQAANKPATTITSHISKDGHYFIHYDPDQCRSLTVREAARIQTFPDNYYFWGTKTKQYHQVGNAVPPFLAKQLAEIVNTIINDEH
ncbi:MAG: DNA cytosine methyltransferase [Bacteroidales bacterium]|nr:DNA cytosine methyltransferase [Bacteroidales bacterium]